MYTSHGSWSWSSSTPNQNSFWDSFTRAIRGQKNYRSYLFSIFDFGVWPRLETLGCGQPSSHLSDYSSDDKLLLNGDGKRKKERGVGERKRRRVDSESSLAVEGEGVVT